MVKYELSSHQTTSNHMLEEIQITNQLINLMTLLMQFLLLKTLINKKTILNQYS